MIKAAKVCKRCKKASRNFQTADNVWCLPCRHEVASNPWDSSKQPPMLYCNMCGKQVWETYTTKSLCGTCAFAQKVVNKTVNGLPLTPDELKAMKSKIAADIKKAVSATDESKPKMQKGELKRLPKNASPLWTEQWAVQGSGKVPYIVSHKKDGEWQCSCPAWTTTVPREDCKHILKVKLVEKVSFVSKTHEIQLLVSKSSAIMVETVDTKKGKLALSTFEKKGRKFR